MRDYLARVLALLNFVGLAHLKCVILFSSMSIVTTCSSRESEDSSRTSRTAVQVVSVILFME